MKEKITLTISILFSITIFAQQKKPVAPVTSILTYRSATYMLAMKAVWVEMETDLKETITFECYEDSLTQQEKMLFNSLAQWHQLMMTNEAAADTFLTKRELIGKKFDVLYYPTQPTAEQMSFFNAGEHNYRIADIIPCEKFRRTKASTLLTDTTTIVVNLYDEFVTGLLNFKAIQAAGEKKNAANSPMTVFDSYLKAVKASDVSKVKTLSNSTNDKLMKECDGNIEMKKSSPDKFSQKWNKLIQTTEKREQANVMRTVIYTTTGDSCYLTWGYGLSGAVALMVKVNGKWTVDEFMEARMKDELRNGMLAGNEMYQEIVGRYVKEHYRYYNCGRLS